MNSPYKFTDPLGLLSVTTGACGTSCLNTAGGGGGYSRNYDSGHRNGPQMLMQWVSSAVGLAAAAGVGLVAGGGVVSAAVGQDEGLITTGATVTRSVALQPIFDPETGEELPAIMITVVPNQGEYNTRDEAALAVLNGINPISIAESAEYSGSVYRTKNGKFGFTTPVRYANDEKAKRRSPTSYTLEKNYKLRLGSGNTFAAGYHTHGAPDKVEDDEVFSGGLGGGLGDIATAWTPGRVAPLYLATPRGRGLVYEPTDFNLVLNSPGTPITVDGVKIYLQPEVRSLGRIKIK